MYGDNEAITKHFPTGFDLSPDACKNNTIYWRYYAIFNLLWRFVP